MQVDLYHKYFNDYFTSSEIRQSVDDSVDILLKSKRIFFIGNRGSNSICSHMMEDFAKRAKYPTFAFSDAALITCYANDYGYEKAMEEWLKIHFNQTGDVLIAISSSGESKNILNAVDFAKSQNHKIITLTGFNQANTLSKNGDVNFILPVADYGIVECFHQVILHIVLDILETKKIMRIL